MWCKHCKRIRPTNVDDSTASVCCNECGRVITQYSIFDKLYSSEINEGLNTKAETRFKTIIWERMNQQAEDQRAALAKSRKERQQKQALEGKRTKAVENCLEETGELVTKKRLSSRVNYDVLEKLLNDDDSFSDPKKSRVESEEDIDSIKQGLNDKEDKTATKDNNDEIDVLQNDGMDDEFNDEYDDEQCEYGTYHLDDTYYSDDY